MTTTTKSTYSVKRFYPGQVMRQVGRVMFCAKGLTYAVINNSTGEVATFNGHLEAYGRKYIAQMEADCLNRKAATA